MKKLVAQGTNIQELSQYESLLQEGDKAELRLYLKYPVSNLVVSGLQTSLQTAGVPLWDNVKQASNIIYVRFKKGFPWLVVIIAVMVLAIIILLAMGGWQLFRELKALGIPNWAIYLGGAVVLYLVLRKVLLPVATRGAIRNPRRRLRGN